jgi:hypothetical protein
VGGGLAGRRGAELRQKARKKVLTKVGAMRKYNVNTLHVRIIYN